MSPDRQKPGWRLPWRLLPGLMVVAGLGWAEPAPGAVDLASQGTIFIAPLDEDGEATTVYVAMGLIDIDEINSAEQNFVANVMLQLRWHDDRLAHGGAGPKVFPLSAIWTPQMVFVNAQKVWPSMPEVAYVPPNGDVYYRQRVWGPFSQPLEVHEFPFDAQDFVIRVASAPVFPETLRLLKDPKHPSIIADDFSLPDWEIQGWELDFSPYYPTKDWGTGADSFAMVIHARRYVSNYVYKVIIPLLLIVAMSWIVFWIDPKEAGTQIGVSTTSMLTLIAYRFMVGGALPEVPYLTRMDYFILGSTLLVFASLGEAVVSSLLFRWGREVFARRLDVACRVAFPLLFILISTLSFKLL